MQPMCVGVMTAVHGYMQPMCERCCAQVPRARGGGGGARLVSAAQRAERPRDPGGVAAFMSAHSKTPYITPSMEFSSGEGVVRGRRVQQLTFTLICVRGRQRCSPAAPSHRLGSHRARLPSVWRCRPPWQRLWLGSWGSVRIASAGPPACMPCGGGWAVNVQFSHLHGPEP